MKVNELRALNKILYGNIKFTNNTLVYFSNDATPQQFIEDYAVIDRIKLPKTIKVKFK